MKTLFRTILILLILNSCNNKKAEYILLSGDSELLTQLGYPSAQLEEELQRQDISLIASDTVDIFSQISLKLTEATSEEPNDGYKLLHSKNGYELSAECTRGLVYGLLDIAEQLKQGKTWDELEGKDISAHYPFRAIKFNLPWYSYRSGENLSLHYETCRDLNYWKSFLDMMVENKFNTLTLWNMHPYMHMVKSKKFPKASPFSDEEMAEWKSFWKTLFKMAKDRGIETYIVNWNIFVSEEFSKEYGTAKYSSSKNYWGDGESNQLIEEYTREMVALTINEYEDLTGIGLTLGERMGGMTSEERRDWIDRTMIAGLKAADRKARLIYRAPLSAGKTSHGTTSVSTEKITRATIENMELDQDVWVEFKFNWSHAHSSPKVSIVHGGMLTDTYWEPLSDKYKGVWTMRNEDFFVIRWAQPDFIREFIGYNSQPYIGGCIIGSETYIPAKDYITKEEFKTWNYAFERQWLFYKVWGNLLYNSSTSDDYFAQALNDRFDVAVGDKLLEAWKLSSMNANRFASFFRGTWDATIYTEGFTTIGGRFISLNEFIVHPVLDSAYVNISDFVSGKFNDEKQITPIELAELTKSESQKALDIIQEIRSTDVSQALEIELTDIEFWANYGFYFSNKIKAGVALEEFRNGLNDNGQKEALTLLEGGISYWKNMVELAEKYNVASMPYQFDPDFSWRKHIVDVEHDVKIAKENIISDEKIDLR